MSTVEADIEGALFQRVMSLALSPALPIAWPNKQFNKPNSFLRVDHLPNRNLRVFIASTAPQRRMGILQLSLNTPLDVDAIVSKELAGVIAAHFPTDIQLVKNDVSVRITQAPDVGQGRSDGKHWMTPVSIYYECFA